MSQVPASIDELLAASHTNSETGPRQSRCCCEREDCAYLKYNTNALNSALKDVRTAAGVGQALLARHEQHVLAAGKDRTQLAEKISKLEGEKRTLELENARTTEENKYLTDQLEELNTALADSEARVKSLEAALYSTQQEAQRFETLAIRAGQLDIRVAELEAEQNALQNRITTTREEERFALRRWQQTEREKTHLEGQLEMIEREAREEKERHEEILARMERQRSVQKALDTCAIRLKGTAAATLGSGKNGHVVSNFVKDILQDNANLQLGIMELRELLTNSNDEVQHLREMLMDHPLENGHENREGTPSLQVELTPKESAINQELHIHHHYHATARPVLKKKRAIISSAHSTPPGTPKRRGKGYGRLDDTQTPRHSNSRRNSEHMHPTPSSAAAAILSQTSVTVPSNSNSGFGDHRWSLQSLNEFAPSSAPSSPNGSMYRNSMLFDVSSRSGFYGDEGSRPTSPGSSVDGMLSPLARPWNRKRGSDMSGRSFTVPTGLMGRHAIQEEGDDFQNEDVDEMEDLSQATNADRKRGYQMPDSNIPNGASNLNNTNTTTDGENGTSSEPSPDSEEPRHDKMKLRDYTSYMPPRKLHRTASQESIISISGLDIHTLKSRPQQIEMGNSRSSHRRPRGDGSNGSLIPTPSLLSSSSRSTGPLVAASDATAVGVASDRYSLDFGPAANASARRVSSSAYLRENFIAAGQRARSRGSIEDTRGLGQKVGGWISSRWGASPTASREGLRTHLDVVDNTQAIESSSASINSTQSSTSVTSSKPGSITSSAVVTGMIMGRPPGINQKGPIPGWSSKKREPTPSQVVPMNVNLEGLSSALEE